MRVCVERGGGGERREERGERKRERDLCGERGGGERREEREERKRERETFDLKKEGWKTCDSPEMELR